MLLALLCCCVSLAFAAHPRSIFLDIGDAALQALHAIETFGTDGVVLNAEQSIIALPMAAPEALFPSASPRASPSASPSARPAFVLPPWAAAPVIRSLTLFRLMKTGEVCEDSGHKAFSGQLKFAGANKDWTRHAIGSDDAVADCLAKCLFLPRCTHVATWEKKSDQHHGLRRLCVPYSQCLSTTKQRGGAQLVDPGVLLFAGAWRDDTERDAAIAAQWALADGHHFMDAREAGRVVEVAVQLERNDDHGGGGGSGGGSGDVKVVNTVRAEFASFTVDSGLAENPPRAEGAVAAATALLTAPPLLLRWGGNANDAMYRCAGANDAKSITKVRTSFSLSLSLSLSLSFFLSLSLSLSLSCSFSLSFSSFL